MLDLWTSLRTVLFLLVLLGPNVVSNAARAQSPPRPNNVEHRQLTSTVLTTTTESEATTSQRLQACRAASQKQPFETSESIHTDFYYELVVDHSNKNILQNKDGDNSDPAVVQETASIISNLVADHLTSAYVLTNCRSTPSKHNQDTTGRIRAVRGAPSRVVSKGACGQPQPNNGQLQQQPQSTKTSSASLWCYRIVGSNTVFLDDQDMSVEIDVPALEEALSNKIGAAFDAWIPVLGGANKDKGIHDIRKISPSEPEELGADATNGTDTDASAAAANWGQLGAPKTAREKNFQSVPIMIQLNFFYAMFLMGILLVALAVQHKHPGIVEEDDEDDSVDYESDPDDEIIGMQVITTPKHRRKKKGKRVKAPETPRSKKASEGQVGDTSSSSGSSSNNRNKNGERKNNSNGETDHSTEDRSNPFSFRGGQTLVWSNVSMTLLGRRHETDRKLLDNIWGEVPPKQTTAIMGPSGAGKTSLLNILAGRACSRGRVKVESEIRLSNYAVDPTSIQVRHMIAFVAQDDSLQMTATPREAIRFSAKLRLALSTTERELDALTTKMLTELGLTACADTIVGGPLLKGISGGERKRTSIGVELVVKPALIYLDEPTSGLDSFSAVQVCQVLRRVADAGATVLFTIHQPSSEIFTSFDNLILMNRGRVMYQGPCGDVTEYFAEKGFACPKKFNPADFVMNVAQETPILDLEAAGFFPPDERELGPALQLGNGESAYSVLSSDKCSAPRTAHSMISYGGLIEVLMLFMREMVNVKRDPGILTPRTTMVAIIGTMIGIIFFQVGEVSPAVATNLQSQFGAIIVLITMSLMSTAQPTLLTFPDERPVFIREYSTRHYSVMSYFVSRLAVEAMLTALQMFIMVLICYYMVGFQGTFVFFFTACYALAMTSTALAAVTGAATGGNGELALQFMPILFAPQMLFTGYFVAPDLIPVWLAWLQYVFPAAYAVRLLVVEEFDQCSTDPLEALHCDALMESLSVTADDTWWYWLILGCQFVVFRVLALAILHANALRFY